LRPRKSALTERHGVAILRDCTKSQSIFENWLSDAGIRQGRDCVANSAKVSEVASSDVWWNPVVVPGTRVPSTTGCYCTRPTTIAVELATTVQHVVLLVLKPTEHCLPSQKII
jgi:hypothetical protein